MDLYAAIVCLHVLNICCGVVLNLVLVYKLCTSKLPRNPLLLGLIVSDLSVCVISCPIIAYKLLHKPMITTSVNAIFLGFIEDVPASCATLSMMCLAIDRYCVVKKFEPFNRKITRRTLPYIVGLIWLVSSFMVLVEIITYYHNYSWIILIIGSKLTIVNVIPIVMVLISHIFLYTNLTAVSLTARAKHGELPLPIPIIQSKKPDLKSHVIIVAGMSKPEDLNEADSSAVAENNVPNNLRNRKRLGNFMLAMALCFFCMWTPYTACQFFNVFLEGGVENEFLELTKCIALLHSGINPLLSIASMDRDWNKSTLAACRGLDHLNEHKSPSSTNEDALGPFNPRFVKPNKKANYNRRSSSVLIY